MNLSHNLRDLLWENPMTLEATRTLRRTLRAGNNNENPYATRKLNTFLVGVLAFLYLSMLIGIVRSNENISVYLLVTELILLTLIVPCSLYGAIAVEREKLTYESLIMTRLTPAQIVWGKLWWRIGLILGVMTLFVPLFVVSQLCDKHGSADFTTPQLIWAQLQVFTWSVFVGAFSLWVSAKSKKGITALLGIIGVLIAFTVMIPVLVNMFSGMNNSIASYDDPMRAFQGQSAYPPSEVQATLSAYRRWVFWVLTTNLLYSLNPFVLVSLPFSLHTGTPNAAEFWRTAGIQTWGVGVYVGLTALLVRAAIHTLRGLEMPVAERVRRSALRVGKKGA